jgi:hypothetical protein
MIDGDFRCPIFPDPPNLITLLALAELNIVKFGIQAASLQQFLMRPLLNDGCLLTQNDICSLYRRQTVGNHDTRLSS